MFQIFERRDRILRQELASDGIEHPFRVADRLDRDEDGTANLVRAHHPPRELRSKRGLAFAALATHHGVPGLSVLAQ